MWKLRPEDRLKEWKHFRHSLSSMPLDEALAKTAEFWAAAPYTPFYLDWKDLKSWPDPWTLIHENHYCSIAKGFGAFCTLLYSDNEGIDDIKMCVYDDKSSNVEYSIVFINNEYILKSQFGSVINTQQHEIEDRLLKTIFAKDFE